MSPHPEPIHRPGAVALESGYNERLKIFLPDGFEVFPAMSLERGAVAC
jgi:hypothetical protein